MTDLSAWTPCPVPEARTLSGDRIALERFDRDRHCEELYLAACQPEHESLWRYLPVHRPESADALGSFLQVVEATPKLNWRVYAFISNESGRVCGMSSYMRLRPEHGSAEIGCVLFSPALQRTRMATEAMYLMARHVFDDLGYRRYEWKCHNDNEASKRAALRLGFKAEGVFRNDMVVKGENRDTAWFSMTDTDWPQVRSALEAWLAPDNFDQDGQQIQSLGRLRDAN
ncbi:MAG: GNAT family protein [Pseudomonadota bacterium]